MSYIGTSHVDMRVYTQMHTFLFCIQRGMFCSHTVQRIEFSFSHGQSGSVILSAIMAHSVRQQAAREAQRSPPASPEEACHPQPHAQQRTLFVGWLAGWWGLNGDGTMLCLAHTPTVGVVMIYRHAQTNTHMHTKSLPEESVKKTYTHFPFFLPLSQTLQGKLRVSRLQARIMAPSRSSCQETMVTISSVGLVAMTAQILPADCRHEVI